MKVATLLPLTPRKYGVTERKKAELDQLANQVLQAQYNVEQQQAIVDSLTAKSTTFQAYLADAEKNQAQALSNKTMMDETVRGAFNLRNNSQVAFDKMVLAHQRTKDVASGMKVLIDKLIYSAEVIDKLSNLVIRQKALNPLISDELVAVIGTAGKDANNAVSLTLVALKSTFVAQAGALESEASASLEYMQAMQLFEIITGIDSKEVLDQAFAVVKNFKPMPNNEFAALVGKTKEVAMDGKYELFKTSTTFDGTVKHPEWLGGDVDAVKKMAARA